MGHAISHTIQEQQKQNNEETVEELQMLHKMLVNKVSAASATLKDEALQDKSLPIAAVVDTSEKYSVKVSNVPSAEIQDAVNEILSGDFLEGLDSLLHATLNTFLGNTSAGESETKDFHVVFANNSLLRVDYMLYKYEFSSKGLKKEFQNGFCHYSQIGVLDIKKTNPQILLYELTRSIGEKNLHKAAEHLQGLATFATELYSVVNKLNEAAVESSKGPEEENDADADAGEGGGKHGGDKKSSGSSGGSHDG